MFVLNFLLPSLGTHLQPSAVTPPYLQDATASPACMRGAPSMEYTHSRDNVTTVRFHPLNRGPVCGMAQPVREFGIEGLGHLQPSLVT